MKKLLSAFVVGAALSLFASCQKETGSGGPGTIPQSVLNQFASLYPTATNVQWTTKGNDYAIATFTLTNTKANGAQNSAWFALQSGSWGMTETEILFDQLPEAVKTAFNASEYAQAPWYLDDQEIDVIYRGEGQETLYVIEVEQRDNNQTIEMKLYYTADGTLTKEFGKVSNSPPPSNRGLPPTTPVLRLLKSTTRGPVTRLKFTMKVSSMTLCSRPTPSGATPKRTMNGTS